MGKDSTKEGLIDHFRRGRENQALSPLMGPRKESDLILVRSGSANKCISSVITFISRLHDL